MCSEEADGPPGGAFYKDTFYSLTLSFNGTLPFGSVSGLQLLSHWKALNQAVKTMITSDRWSGAFWVDEVSIANVAPLRAIPHAHAIIHTDQLTHEHLAELSELITNYTGTNDEPAEISLKPSLKAELITSEEDFEKAVAYLHKPINLYQPYERARARMLAEQEITAEQINRSMREFIEGLPVITHGFHRSYYEGTCSSKRPKSFIGVKRADRIEKQSHNS